MKKRLPYLMMIGTYIVLLNNVSLNVALPSIMIDLQVESYATVQWLTTGAMLVAGVLIPTTAFFITKFKSHHVFITAMSIFTTGTVLAIFAPNFPILLTARLIQAAGSSMLAPLLMNVLLVSFSREQRGKALGIYGLIIMIPPITAPMLSGFIVNTLGWRAIFMTIAPIAVIILVLAIFRLENMLEQRDVSIDTWSAILSTISFSFILFGINNASSNDWTDLSVFGLILIGLVTLAMFSIRQFKLETPFLNLRVYKYSMFALSSIISVILAMLLYSPFVIMPYYLQIIQGYSALRSGVIVLLGALLMASCMPLAGKIFDKVGAFPLALVGFPLIGISAYFMSMLQVDTSPFYVAIWFSVRSIGTACVMMPLQTNGLNQLPKDLTPSATAVNATLQQVFGAIGTTFFVTLQISYEATRGAQLLHEAGYPSSLAIQEEISRQAGLASVNYTFLVTVGFSVVALFFSLFIRRRVYHEDAIVEEPATKEISAVSKGV